MRDWTMNIETFAGGRHNFPKLTLPKSSGPRRFVTTLRQFTGTKGRVHYVDHVLPWRVDARNLELSIAKSDKYRGTARFRDGVITIMKYEPMWAHMQTGFVIDGSRVTLPRIDLQADGSTTQLRGDVNIGNWPEQVYDIERSTIDFARMRELFFANRDFTLTGTGQFTGRFALAKGFRELTGRFRSPRTRLSLFDFDDVRGSLIWTREQFEVIESRMAFAGGQLGLNYRFGPFGAPTPAHQRLDARYTGVDVEQISRIVGLNGMQVAGRADGRHLLDFPSGRFDLRTGDGEMVVAAPEGQRMQGRELIDLTTPPPAARRPLDRDAPLGRLPLVAELRYAYQGTRIDVARSYAATPETYVEFSGRTESGDASDFDFHVTSRDWQESDRLHGRDHDRRRRTDAPRRGGRVGHVRRPDDRSLQGASRRGAVQRARPAGVGRDVGHGADGPRRREQLRGHRRRRDREGRRPPASHGALLPRLSASRRRRGDARAHPDVRLAAARPAARVRARRLSGGRPALGRLPAAGRLPRPRRLRPSAPEGGRGLRRALRHRDVGAAVRWPRRVPRRPRHHQVRWPRQRIGLRRVGWHVSFQGRRARHPRVERPRPDLGGCPADRHAAAGGRGRRDIPGPAVRRARGHRRSLRRRRRHRTGHRAALDPRPADVHRRARDGLVAPGRVGHGAHAVRRQRRQRHHAHVRRYVAGPVPARVQSPVLPVHVDGRVGPAAADRPVQRLVASEGRPSRRRAAPALDRLPDPQRRAGPDRARAEPDADRPHAPGGRGHATRRRGRGGPRHRAHEHPAARRRQPRPAAGRAAGRACVRCRGGLGRTQRAMAIARRRREHPDHGRPPALRRAAAFARGHQRDGALRHRRRVARGRQCTPRGRSGALRRARRVRRRQPERVQRDGDGVRDAHPVPRGLPIDCRRGPGAARPCRPAHAERHGERPRRRADTHDRHQRHRCLRPRGRRPRHRRPTRSRPGTRSASTSASRRRPPCASRTTRHAWCRAPS